MTVGIIVDGDAESQALRKITSKLIAAKPCIGPFYANMQPLAPPPTIARAAMKTIQVAKARGATELVILIDRENNDDCPTTIAENLVRAFDRLGHEVQVVVKNRSFENWLIADPGALAIQRQRFSVSRAVRRKISPNKADNIDDAFAILNRCAIRTAYHKRRDAITICEKLDLALAASNSRSIRRFLRVLGDDRYKAQSRLP